jgi:hypothetical protein
MIFWVTMPFRPRRRSLVKGLGEAHIDKETGRQGDKETSTQESFGARFSPCLLVSLSPCLSCTCRRQRHAANPSAARRRKGTTPCVSRTPLAPAARCRIADDAPARLARCPLRRPPATPTWAARFLGRNVYPSPRKTGKRDDAVVAWGQAAARPRRAVWCRLGIFTDKRNSGPRTIPAQTTKACRRSKKTDCTDGSKYDVKKPRTTPAWKVRSFNPRSRRAVRPELLLFRLVVLHLLL